MTTNQDKLNFLIEKLEILLKRQDDFSKEINELRNEVNFLKSTGTEQPDVKEDLPDATHTEQSIVEENFQPAWLVTEPESEVRAETAKPGNERQQPFPKQEPPKQPNWPITKPPADKSDLEKFIGENLINKIGIAITVIGVAIGAKYAIDHQLISPLTRIILGYLFGAALLGVAIRLKKDYENFSAVLLSGSMAIIYFITYAAYSFYGLIPQVLAFMLMVIFTAFTVVAAINYNMQIIAHIGLVGAYAVPFLLSDGSGKVAILFSYTAIINVGILVIAFKKYWKPLYFVAFGLTWVMYVSWFASKYKVSEHFGLALTFLTVFFSIFYLTLLAYKLLQKEKFVIEDILMLLVNSFIFYGIGYAILNNHETGKQLLGLFTLCNAIIHFIVSAIIYRQKLGDRNLFYLISGLVLVFITIAIPVQLDGNWVTLLWAGEATLLFWIGRTKNVPVYETLSFPLMFLAFFSIFHDWTSVYDTYNVDFPGTKIIPLFNINFLSSVLFITVFWFINMLNRNEKYTSSVQAEVSKILKLTIPSILLITIYFAFQMEIANYWDQLFKESVHIVNTADQQNYYQDYDLIDYRTISIINYSLLFVSVLAFVNIKKFRNQQLSLVNFVLIVFSLGVFLLQGLYTLSELRESYLDQTLAQYYTRGIFNIIIRYISFAFVILTLVACYKYTREEFIKRDFKILFDFILHTTVLWIASSELIHWMDMSGSTQTYKIGLSILWGMYSLFLIAFGIGKKKKHLRIGAIALFAATLIKLFLYDISHLDTISKTIVFVSLGVLLLIISFLYNKYKHSISDESVS